MSHTYSWVHAYGWLTHERIAHMNVSHINESHIFMSQRWWTRNTYEWVTHIHKSHIMNESWLRSGQQDKRPGRRWHNLCHHLDTLHLPRGVQSRCCWHVSLFLCPPSSLFPSPFSSLSYLSLARAHFLSLSLSISLLHFIYFVCVCPWKFGLNTNRIFQNPNISVLMYVITGTCDVWIWEIWREAGTPRISVAVSRCRSRRLLPSSIPWHPRYVPCRNNENRLLTHTHQLPCTRTLTTAHVRSHCLNHTYTNTISHEDSLSPSLPSSLAFPSFLSLTLSPSLVPLFLQSSCCFFLLSIHLAGGGQRAHYAGSHHLGQRREGGGQDAGWRYGSCQQGWCDHYPGRQDDAWWARLRWGYEVRSVWEKERERECVWAAGSCHLVM